MFGGEGRGGEKHARQVMTQVYGDGPEGRLPKRKELPMREINTQRNLYMGRMISPESPPQLRAHKNGIKP